MEPKKGDKIVITLFSLIICFSTLLFQLLVIHKLQADIFSTIFMIFGAALISDTLRTLYYRFFINEIKKQN